VPKTHTLGFFLANFLVKTMGKLFFYILVFLFIFATPIISTKVYAETAGTSASLVTSLVLQVPKTDNRAKILEAYLQNYDSPLASYADVFINEADKNNLDWKLLPAIAGVESYFGHYIPAYSYNGWGFGVYGTNVRRFSSWEDAIKTISKELRENYVERLKSQNVYQIGSMYAADPLWPTKVNHFIETIEEFEKNSQNKSLPISL
jgi:hypothetical protein